MIDKKLFKEAIKIKYRLIFVGILSVISGSIILWQMSILAKVVAGIFIEKKSGLNFSNDFILFFVLIIARTFVGWLKEYVAKNASAILKRDIREKLVNKIFELGPVGLGDKSTGETINLVDEGVEVLDEYFSGYIPQIFTVALLPIIILMVAFTKDKLTSMIFLFTAPIIPIMMTLIGKAADEKSKKQWKTLGRISGYFFEILQGLTTLKIFNMSKSQSKSVYKMSEEFRRSTMNVLKIAFLSAFTLEFLSTVSTALVAVSLAVRLINKNLSFEVAFFLLLIAPEFYLPFRQLGVKFHSGISGVTAYEKIDELLNFKFKGGDDYE